MTLDTKIAIVLGSLVVLNITTILIQIELRRLHGRMDVLEDQIDRHIKTQTEVNTAIRQTLESQSKINDGITFLMVRLRSKIDSLKKTTS